jgi:hypothetical protein
MDHKDMTVTDAVIRDKVTGTGLETILNTSFIFNDSSEIKVTKRVTATGVETVLTETTHYIVDGGEWLTGTVVAADEDVATEHFPNTVTWTIERVTPLTQATDLAENEDLPADVIERALDKLTLLIQELYDGQQRSLRFPVTDDDTLDAILPDKDNRASNYLAFDAAGEPISAAAPAGTTTVSAFMADVLEDNDALEARTTLEAQEDLGASLITARGDMIVGDASGDPSTLALGTAGQVMAVRRSGDAGHRSHRERLSRIATTRIAPIMCCCFRMGTTDSIFRRNLRRSRVEATPRSRWKERLLLPHRLPSKRACCFPSRTATRYDWLALP